MTVTLSLIDVALYALFILLLGMQIGRVWEASRRATQIRERIKTQIDAPWISTIPQPKPILHTDQECIEAPPLALDLKTRCRLIHASVRARPFF